MSDLLDAKIESAFGGPKATCAKMRRLTELGRIFTKLEKGKVLFDIDEQWSAFALAHDVGVDKVLLDLKAFEKRKFIQSIHVGFTEKKRMVCAYAIKLPDLIQPSFRCLECGSFIPTLYKEFKTID